MNTHAHGPGSPDRNKYKTSPGTDTARILNLDPAPVPISFWWEPPQKRREQHYILIATAGRARGEKFATGNGNRIGAGRDGGLSSFPVTTRPVSMRDCGSASGWSVNLIDPCQPIWPAEMAEATGLERRPDHKAMLMLCTGSD